MSTVDLEIRVERDSCLGSQACMRRAPGSFELGADGKARVVEPPGDPEPVLIEAAQACPTFSVRISRGGKTLV